MKTERNNRRIAAIIQLILVSLVAIISLATARTVYGVDLSPGDIVVGQSFGVPTTSLIDPAIVRVDPVTGDRTIISDNTVGSGPSFVPPGATKANYESFPYLSWQSDGSILATELLGPASGAPNTSEIFRVDPATGDRTLISSVPFALNAAEPFGDTILATAYPNNVAVYSINPATGNPTIISGPGVGTGPNWAVPGGFVSLGTNLFVTDEGLGIVKLDALTGNRTVISGPGVGTGPTMEGPDDVKLDPLGNLLVMTVGNDDSTGALVRIDPVTGNRTIVSSNSVGAGPSFFANGNLAVSQSGSIFMTGLPDKVIQVDPLTGNRTILADATHGTGPWSATSGLGILVVPNVPEPSSIALLTIGAIGLAAVAWRRR